MPGSRWTNAPTATCYGKSPYFLSFPFYSRKPRHREGGNFAHSHTAGRWQSQSLNTSSSAPERPISTTVLPIISETRVLFRSLSLSPFWGVKMEAPERKITHPVFHSWKDWFLIPSTSSASRSLPGPLPSALPLLSWVWKQPRSWLTGGPLLCQQRGPVRLRRERPGGARERGVSSQHFLKVDLLCASASAPSAATTSPVFPKAPSMTWRLFPICK